MKILILIPLLFFLFSCSPEKDNGNNGDNNQRESFGDTLEVVIKELGLENTHYGFSTELLSKLSGKDKKSSLSLLYENQLDLLKERDFFLSFAPSNKLHFSTWNNWSPPENRRGFRNSIRILDPRDGIMLSRNLKSGAKLSIIRNKNNISGSKDENWVFNAALNWMDFDISNQTIGVFNSEIATEIKDFQPKLIGAQGDLDDVGVVLIDGKLELFDGVKCKTVVESVSKAKNIIISFKEEWKVPECIKILVKDEYGIELSTSANHIPPRNYEIKKDKISVVATWWGWKWDIYPDRFKSIDQGFIKEYFDLYHKFSSKSFEMSDLKNKEDVISGISKYVEYIESVNSDNEWTSLSLPDVRYEDGYIFFNDDFPFYLLKYSLDGGNTYHRFTGNYQKLPIGIYKENVIKVGFVDSLNVFRKGTTKVEVTINDSKVVISNIEKYIDFEHPIKKSNDGNYIQISGRPDGYGLDWVFVAEGYQSHEKEKFLNDVKIALPFNRNEPLFEHLLEAYNIHILFAHSNETGASDDKLTVDTAFNARYRGRLLYGDESKVSNYISAYMAQFPELRTVIVNSDRYGGAAILGGGAAWTYRGNEHVSTHETAHAFAGLHDEYIYQRNFCDKNVCYGDNYEKAYWSHYLKDLKSPYCNDSSRMEPRCVWATPSRGTNSWGESVGWYGESSGTGRRPSYSGVMHYGGPFRKVGSEIWARALYRTTKPFLTYDEKGVIVNRDTLSLPFIPGKEVKISVAKLLSDVRLEWFINNKKIDNNLESISYIPKLNDKIKVVGYDNSGLIHPSKLDDTHREFVWSFDNENHSDYFTSSSSDTYVRAKIKVTPLSIELISTKYSELYATPVGDYIRGVDSDLILHVNSVDGNWSYLPKNMVRIEHSSYEKISEEHSLIYEFILKSGVKYNITSRGITQDFVF